MARRQPLHCNGLEAVVSSHVADWMAWKWAKWNRVKEITHIIQLTENTFAQSAGYFLLVKVIGNPELYGSSPQFIWHLERGPIFPEQNCFQKHFP